MFDNQANFIIVITVGPFIGSAIGSVLGYYAARWMYKRNKVEE